MYADDLVIISELLRGTATEADPLEVEQGRNFQSTMRKTIRLKSGVGFWPDKFPLSTAKVLIDAVGYVCSESVKCDDCLPQTLGDELTLSLAVTLNQG